MDVSRHTLNPIETLYKQHGYLNKNNSRHTVNFFPFSRHTVNFLDVLRHTPNPIETLYSPPSSLETTFDMSPLCKLWLRTPGIYSVPGAALGIPKKGKRQYIRHRIKGIKPRKKHSVWYIVRCYGRNLWKEFIIGNNQITYHTGLTFNAQEYLRF